MSEKTKTITKTNNFAQKVTEHSTFLLMLSVIVFFINSLFSYYIDPTTGLANAVILGDAFTLGNRNVVNLVGVGALFAVLSQLLNSIVILCAGLSFAAVCFDEDKNIYFRVICVAALMLIMFGGINLF